MNLDWKDAISFIQGEQEKTDDKDVKLIWQRLKIGDRTQDLLMQIAAHKSLKDESVSQSPEWQNAIKWLTYQRAQRSDLLLDMLWKQLESGDRTPELLTLIRQAAGQAPVVLQPESESPPSSNF